MSGWVFDEVLPSIRRHGAYITPEMLWEVATTPEALMKLCSDLLPSARENAVLLEANAQLQGKAFYFGRLYQGGPLYQPANHRQGAGSAGTPVSSGSC